MSDDRPKNSFWSALGRGVIWISLIIFLLYSVLLMREFTSGNGDAKTLAVALGDILTAKIFAVALVASSVVFLGHRYLHRRS
jgi:prepilin signal peptidase PulO-like enzyme (type II secretory pathway)